MAGPMDGPGVDRPDLIPLIDLDRDEADRLLSALTNVGLEAVVTRVDTGGRDGALTRSLMRVFVPRSELTDARRVVAGVLPRYASHSPREDHPESSSDSPGKLAASESEQWSQIVADLRSDGLDPTPAIADPDGTYSPPEPPPLPRPSGPVLLAWGGIGVGLALIVLAAVLGSVGILALLGVIAFIGGFIALVARAGNGRRDDGDDGAIV